MALKIKRKPSARFCVVWPLPISPYATSPLHHPQWPFSYSKNEPNAFCLRAFALTVPSTWNFIPENLCLLAPSLIRAFGKILLSQKDCARPFYLKYNHPLPYSLLHPLTLLYFLCVDLPFCEMTY